MLLGCSCCSGLFASCKTQCNSCETDNLRACCEYSALRDCGGRLQNTLYWLGEVKTCVSEATEEVTQSRSRSEKLGEEVAGRRGTSAKRLGISAKR